MVDDELGESFFPFFFSSFSLSFSPSHPLAALPVASVAFRVASEALRFASEALRFASEALQFASEALLVAS